MPRAFFIIGCESSGTRMMAEAFVRVGCWGDVDNIQRLDTLHFNIIPPDTDIVFRRSVPHAKKWPPLFGIYNMLKAHGFEVIPIIIQRDDLYTAQSQIARGHASTLVTAKWNVERGRKYITSQMKKLGINPKKIKYERFVTKELVRKNFFDRYDLPVPDMEFYNANLKYQEE